jgi:hypothetical protein
LQFSGAPLAQHQQLAGIVELAVLVPVEQLNDADRRRCEFRD